METRMTLRLPDSLAADLAAVARADCVSVADAAREAVREHVDRRWDDPEFQARMRRVVGEQQETLRRLAG